MVLNYLSILSMGENNSMLQKLFSIILLGFIFQQWLVNNTLSLTHIKSAFYQANTSDIYIFSTPQDFDVQTKCNFCIKHVSSVFDIQ